MNRWVDLEDGVQGRGPAGGGNLEVLAYCQCLKLWVSGITQWVSVDGEAYPRLSPKSPQCEGGRGGGNGEEPATEDEKIHEVGGKQGQCDVLGANELCQMQLSGQ